MGILLLVIVLVLGGVGIYISNVVSQQRAKAFQAFAAAHSLALLGSTWDLGDAGFALFHSGNRRYWRNVLRGTYGELPVTYCDYSYVVSSGKSSSTYSFSNVLGVVGMEIPQVIVAPRGALSTLAERSIGAPGIKFESLDFNDRFDVHCDDQAFATELIDARMIETLLGLDPGFHVVFGSEYLMVYCSRRPVEEIGGLFDATVAVAQRIPALVRSQYGPPQPPSPEAPAQTGA